MYVNISQVLQIENFDTETCSIDIHVYNIPSHSIHQAYTNTADINYNTNKIRIKLINTEKMASYAKAYILHIVSLCYILSSECLADK